MNNVFETTFSIADHANAVINQVVGSRTLSGEYNNLYGLIIEEGLKSHLVNTHPDEYKYLSGRVDTFDMGDLSFRGCITDIKSVSYVKGLNLPGHKQGFCISKSCERYKSPWFVLPAIGEVDLIKNQISVKYIRPILVTNQFKQLWHDKGKFHILPFSATGFIVVCERKKKTDYL